MECAIIKKVGNPIPCPHPVCTKGQKPVSEYVFKLKKGDLELELKSDDAKFIETQMDNWRNMLVSQQDKSKD